MTQNENLKIEEMQHPEQGRTMIEMLGTLAIMGVLSIGGIAGYGYAVTKYRANETMEELNKRAVVYATQVLHNNPLSGEFLSHGEYGDKTALGYTIEANNSYYPNEFEVTLTNYPSEVCRDILKNYTIPYQIVVAGKVYDPKSDNYSICGNDGNTAPETLFIYTADLNLGKEEFKGVVSTQQSVEFTGEYTGEFRCEYGQEFLGDNDQCYSCDEGLSFYVYSDEKKELCQACNRIITTTSRCAKKECIFGQEFRDVNDNCFPCETNGSYLIGSQEDYDLCRACGHRSIHKEGEYAYCTPGCMAGQVYHAGQKKCVTPECTSNRECGSGKYCKLDSAQNDYSCTEAPTYGTCESISGGTEKTVEGVGTYVKSGSTMNWWSAQNYCQALEGSIRMATVGDFGCGYDYVGANRTGYCNTDISTSSSGTRSANMQAFQTAFGKSSYYWLSDSYNACHAYYARLSDGRVSYTSRNNSYSYYYALCRVGD